jgi:hypothetical protein
MSEMLEKKGKNFKEVIEEEKNKGKTAKSIMRAITSLNTSVIYGGTFLAVFVLIDVVLYLLLTPSVFVWAGILVVTALVSSLVASRLTNLLKNSQWKYKA